MMKKLIMALMLILLCGIVSAHLGNYEVGDTVTYSVVCLSDEGTKDIGCTGNDDDILDPDDTSAKSPTTAMAEVSDANFPGMWRGDYDIPASPLLGTWSIFIELTNSNSTIAATVLQFQVVNKTTDSLYGYVDVLPATAPVSWDDTYDADNVYARQAVTEGNLSEVDSTLSGMIIADGANSTAILNSILGTNDSIIGNIIDVNTSIITRGDAAWTTGGAGAGLTDTQNATLYGLYTDLPLNITYINGSIENVVAHGDANWISGMTDAQNGSLNAIEGNISDSTYGLSALKTLLDSMFTFMHTIQSYLNSTFYTDMGKNFTATNTEIDESTADIVANISEANISISDLIKDVNGSIIDGVNVEINAINSTIVDEINKTPGRVWNGTWAPERELTNFPVGSISVIDITAEGPYNATFFNSEAGHVLGNIDPENNIKLNSAKWARNGLVIEILPANMTKAEICLWIKRTGNPTGQLGVYMGDDFLYNLSAAGIPLTWEQNCTEVAVENITNYNEITARGESSWTVPNSIAVGMDEQAAVYSYTSTDSGSTWIHSTNELIFWIKVGATAQSVADQLNEKVVNVETHTPFSPCIGSPVNFHWSLYDFKGDQMVINSMPVNCNMYLYTQNGSEINVTDADIQTKIENSYIAWAFWNNTADAQINTSYHIDCNNITVTPPSGDVKSVDVDALFGFTEECSEEGRFEAVYGNQSETDDKIRNLSNDMGQNFTQDEGRYDAIDGNLTKNYNLIGNVWNFLINTSLGNAIWATTTRTLTGIDWSIFNTWTIMQDYVWNATDRTLTYYNRSDIAVDIWNFESVAERNSTSSNERGTDSAELEASASGRYSAVIGNMSDYNSSLSGLMREVNISISDYMSGTILPEVENVGEMIVLINASLGDMILATGTNISIIVDYLFNGSMEKDIVEYLHRQNSTEIWNYNSSETWWLENRTINYSDGVSKVLTFDYDDNGMQNKTSEETY